MKRLPCGRQRAKVRGKKMQAISKAELSFSAPERTVRGASGQVAVADQKGGEATGIEGKGAKIRAMLRARLGEDIYTSWFVALEFDDFDGKTVKASVPVKFLSKWIQSHYSQELLTCCKAEFKSAEHVEVSVRQPGSSSARALAPQPEPAKPRETAAEARPLGSFEPVRMPVARPVAGRTSIDGFEGSPLDPHHTFDNFVVGASNRMAHAGAIQVAETVLTDSPAFNPLYLYSSVGMGKTHLLQAVAWEVKRRAPNAQVLYLTAERFRYQFVEALRAQDPLFQRFQLISDIAFGIHKGLLPDPFRRHLVLMRVAHFKVITEHIVEADLQRTDPGTLHFALLSLQQ